MPDTRPPAPHRGFFRVAETLAILAGWAVLGLALLVTLEVFTRKFTEFSIQGVDEIGGYVLAAGSAIGFSYALLQKAHIRIDMLALRFPPALRAVVDIIAFLLLNLFIWILAWCAITVLIESIRLGARAPTPLGTLLAIPQAIWVLGIVSFGVLAALRVLSSIVMLLRGRTQEAIIELQGPSIAKELEQELADARARLGTRDASVDTKRYE